MSSSEKSKIVDYTPDYKQGVLQLMSDVPFKKLIWSWQYEDNPYGFPFEPIVIKHENKVVGFNGAMNVEIIYDGKTIDAMWSCDFYVQSDFRGKGLGKIVKNKQFNSNSIVMALGLSETAVYIWKKKGCEPNKDICRLRKYKKVDSLRKLIWISLQSLEYIKGLPIRVFSKSYRYTINDSLVNKFNVDELWKTVGNSYSKIVVRNYNYLHWRYEKHPLASYQFIHVFRNNKLTAIGVFRRDKESTRFVDMVAHSEDTKARLALVSGWLKSHSGAKIYSCISTDLLLQKCLLAHGFHLTHDKQWFFVHSSDKNDVYSEKNWFIMPGDSDGDFLEAAATGFE